MNRLRTVLTFPRIRMLLAGGFSVVFSYLVFFLLLQAGVHYQIASVANFLTYWLVNFVLNKTWAFQSQGDTRKEASAHFLLHLGNQAMIMIGLYVLVEHIELHAAWAQIVMQILATLTVFIITPIIFKHGR